MITKYASLEDARVIDLKGSKERVKTASLDKLSEFDGFRTEDGYLYARIRAISSRVNKNNDGWPAIELAGSSEIFDRHQSNESGFTVEAGEEDFGFATFLGKPVFVDHNNSDPDRARGVIVDAKFHVEDHKTAALDPYYSSPDVDEAHLPGSWVELLLEIDANSFPKLAKAVVQGYNDPDKGIDGWSMGCDVEKTVCNICKNAATAPDEYCNHVRLKGATFDYIDPKTGHKTSKKSYENCYGIKFFEISAVFDPADETALSREVRSSVQHEGENLPGYDAWKTRGPEEGHEEACPHCGHPMEHDEYTKEYNCEHCGHAEGPPDAYDEWEADRFSKAAKTAQNPLPQSDLLTAPDDIDTLREENVCPVCGSTMEEHQCDVCGYVAPPPEFDNPDLDKAQDVDPSVQQTDQEMSNKPVNVDNSGGLPDQTTNEGFTASVTSDMAWSLSVHPKLAGKINPVEQPVVPNGGPASNEPKETVVEDHTQPTTSRTARNLIAAAKENRMKRQAAEAPAGTAADKRVDVEGVGGVMDGSNEEASKADVQTDVEGKGGVDQASNQEASRPDSTVDVGKEVRTDDSGPTKTWSGEEGQTDPVQGEAFPTSANKGTQPVDPVGKAQDRVDVEQEVSYENPNSVDDQWTGTDGNGVTKQQPPVTPNSIAVDGWVARTHFMASLKLAELEVEQGLITPEKKYDRMAELEEESLESIEASLKYAKRVKTAGLRKNAATTPKGVGRVPGLGRPGNTQSKEASAEENDDDSVLFM